MEIKRYIVTNKPGSSKRTRTQFIEESIISISPLIKLRTITEAYRKSRHNIIHTLVIGSGIYEDSICIERSSLIDLQKRSFGDISFIRYSYEIFNKIILLDIYEKIPSLMIASIAFKDGEDSNKFKLPSWIGEEITDNEKFSQEYLTLHF